MVVEIVVDIGFEWFEVMIIMNKFVSVQCW